MLFVLVIYHGTYPLPGTPRAEALPVEDQQAAYAAFAALNAMENVNGGPPLGLPEKATTVRVEDGVPVTSAGPYLGVEQAVGGFLVVEADDLDGAVAIAARVPQARLGGAVEVRPSEQYW